ncbi:MAG: hypothetical protein HKP30_01325 [Myxococcales bacterium]|nr:hypothetical protein [Myxococcales bacterium]
MTNDPRDSVPNVSGDPAARTAVYEPPRFEVLALDCEITAYAPDGDDPLF